MNNKLWYIHSIAYATVKKNEIVSVTDVDNLQDMCGKWKN